ncbi:MAG: HAD family hydrolase [Candidatus Bathyarchaeota archaeon]|nr:HAD family hydrolase [Candidatus Bathyarchaeota archaeon]
MVRAAVKAVTFDLWETLLFERDGDSLRRMNARCSSLARALKGLQVEVSKERVKLALDRTISVLVETWDENRDVSHRRQLELLLEYAAIPVQQLRGEWFNVLSRAYMSTLHEVPPYLNPEAPRVLKRLKSQGRRVGLICNTGLTPGAELRRFLEKHAVAGFFDVMVFSDETGVRKPDRRIFEEALRCLEVGACEVVHVGDNLRVDVWGAKNAGLRAAHFHSQEGRDRVAEADPRSLVSLSRSLGSSGLREVAADWVVGSLTELVEVLDGERVG